ncbi:hypothetical protein B0J17DRAFT_706232 [Rhizoctonia solani]|nr:hypothetical protein B0J17DRAFT_706232 [Rhizoctonia solani]
MSVDLSTLNPRAWVVDSRRRPLQVFNLRRIAPDIIECWHLSVVGEVFSIYFTGWDQSAEQKALDIHAVAELDGHVKLDGVVLPSAPRALGHVGGIVDQPVGNETARPLKFGRLRMTDEDDNGNDSEHIYTIQVRLEGKFGELRTLETFADPVNRIMVHERGVKHGNLTSTILGKTKYSPIVHLMARKSYTGFAISWASVRYKSGPRTPTTKPATGGPAN